MATVSLLTESPSPVARLNFVSMIIGSNESGVDIRYLRSSTDRDQSTRARDRRYVAVPYRRSRHHGPPEVITDGLDVVVDSSALRGSEGFN